ncbi:MAG: ribonuclease P protein component [Candidatus Daviesbacteria bacterium]
MLPQTKRLNLKKDFNWVASGKKAENDLIKVFFRFGENGEPKIGIALSKVSFKKATDRNRARRLVSSGFEYLYPEISKDINIIALPKTQILKVNSEEVKKALAQILRKNGLLKS